MLSINRILMSNVLTPLSRSIYSNSVLLCSKQVGGKSKHAPELQSPPPLPSHDWIGPIDKKSNLRRVVAAHPSDETDVEREYRQRREDTMEWNHHFWSLQNERFIKAKEEFVKGRLAEKRVVMDGLSDDGEATSGIKHTLSAEDMAEFYQQFLKDNRRVFREYNMQWYRRNFSLLWPAVRANFHKLMKNKR